MQKDTLQVQQTNDFVTDEKFEQEIVEKLALFYVALARNLSPKKAKKLFADREVKNSTT